MHETQVQGRPRALKPGMPRYPDGLPLKDKLLRGIVVDLETGCWIWQRSVVGLGYGATHDTRTGGKIQTHRASYEVFRGPIPESMLVCHHCDTPRCINPEHLFLGTKSDNARDMFRKGRQGGGCVPKTVCKRGHPLTPETTYRTMCRAMPSRRCKQCMRDWMREYNKRKRQERAA